MTVSRDSHRYIYFECDGKRCAEIWETHTDNFEDALEEMKEANWVVRPVKDNWLHVCPDCQEMETGALEL